jgi:hypothetical protein
MIAASERPPDLQHDPPGLEGEVSDLEPYELAAAQRRRLQRGAPDRAAGTWK